MTQPYDTAFVEILPNFEKFERGVREGVDDAARSIEQTLGKSLDQVAREADRAGDSIGREIGRGGEQAENALEEVGREGKRQFDKIEREASTVGGQIGGTFKRLAVTIAAAFAVGAVANWASFTINSLGNIQRLSAQTDTVLRSMNVTFTDRAAIEGFAASIEKITGIEAELIQEGQNLLLTFGNIRNEVGAGNDIFDRATQAMVNMSVAFGTDASGAAIQLGKALNDPIVGITALTRSGVSFTEAQKEMIKSLVESGDVLSAQRIILSELEKQFGGSAEAFGQTLPGQIAILKNTFGELSETILSGVLPALVPLIGVLTDTFANLVPALAPVLEGVSAALGPVLQVVGETLAEAFQVLAPVIGPLSEAVLGLVKALAPLLPVIAQLIAELLPPLAAVVILVTGVLSPVIAAVAELAETLIADLAPAITPVVPIIGKIADVLGEALAAALPSVIELITVLFAAIKPLIPALLRLVEALLPLLDPMVDLIEELLPPLTDLLLQLLVPLIQLIEPFLDLVILIAEKLVPAMLPVSQQLAAVLVPILQVLAQLLLFTIIPVIDTLSKLLQGDFKGAVTETGGILMFFRDISAAVFEEVSKIVQLWVDGFNTSVARISNAINQVINFFSQLRNSIRDRINDAVAFVRDLPGQILNAVGNLGKLLFDAGRDVIQGLIDGIRSMIGRIADAMSGVTGKIRAFLPSSPAKEGPLSGPGSPDRAGSAISRMLAEGIVGDIAAVRDAVNELVGIVVPPSISPGGSGAGSISFGPGSISINFSGVVPTEAEARATGRAVGDGILDAVTRRNVRAQIRAI